MEAIYKIILIFFIYSICGWFMEVLVAIVKDHKIINRGFLTGPVCPIYGVGGLLILLFLSKYAKEPIIVYCMSIIIASIVEYTTSYVMERIFKNRWWDYSDMKYNINGRICLETMLPFGFLALLMIYIINPAIVNFLTLIPSNTIKIVACILSSIFIIDIILSFNIIITLKNVSNSLRCDSTEVITRKVKEIILGKTFLYRRLLDSFPNMQISNKKAVLKAKIKKNKAKLRQERAKQRKK